MEKKKQNDTKQNIVSFLPTGEYYYQKALQALSRDQYDKAQLYLKRAVELSPNDAMILMQYAIVELESERFEHALQLLNEAYLLEDSESDIVFFLSEVNAHLGFLVDARKYAKLYLEMDPDGSYAEEAMEIMDFTDQEELAQFDLDGEEGERFALQERARKWMENGEFESAISLLEKVIEEHPDFWSAYNNLALAYFYVGEVEQSKALLHDVLRRNTGNLHALCNLAVLHYYEKNEEELTHYLQVLSKIQPYMLEHRYKLGATFALVGKYEQAYKWLRSLQKKGHEGDAGFYFWLSHSAYFSGHEKIARQAWEQLLLLAPDKEGLEPWLGQKAGDTLKGLEHNRDFIVEKLENAYRSERLFGLFLLNKTAHRQEIISHPEWINVEEYSPLEKWMLAAAIGESDDLKTVSPTFLRAFEATNLLYEQHHPVATGGSYLFQMWFVLMERGIDKDYSFRNPKALAAAADYMFQSSREDGITKKAISENYGTTSATLTKYVSELIQFLPLFDA
ncbi:tetratricopeptide repeat protein [Paenisporosarcina cavernae]|uniref:Transcriptional regulator n=1 Tax=Paenisporosarcina cavernae TaxID=2320858 RepID=A0A385YW46_9BACL|nr:tetratricopeptide repeat protein [Paenisporosarcina cavernae]AYC30117.1 transcriptional regulator [Paenisporosarcina cavernae]